METLLAKPSPEAAHDSPRIVEEKSRRHGIRNFTVELSERQAAGLRTNLRKIPGLNPKHSKR